MNSIQPGMPPPDWLRRLQRIIAIVDERDRVEGKPSSSKTLAGLFAAPGISGQALGEIATGLRRSVGWAAAGSPVAILDEPLMQSVLRRSVVCDLDLEQVVRTARSQILGSVEAGTVTDLERRVMASVAIQSFNNGYVVDITSAERGALQRLELECRSRDPHGPRLKDTLFALAMYGLPASADLDALWCRCVSDNRDSVTEALWRLLVLEPDEDRRAASSLTPCSVIDVGDSVTQLYESDPYPRWGDLTVPTSASSANAGDPVFRALAHRTAERPMRVLVAGCGTGRHPIQLALRYTDIDVCAIDISRASVVHAMRRARHYLDRPIRFELCDLRSVSALGIRFHCVEAVGVLHHLKNPVEGLRALARVLVPGGLVKIGLYCREARAPLGAAQSFVRARLRSPDDLPAIRARLIVEAPAAASAAACYRDFFYRAGVRDLLAHPRALTFSSDEVPALCRAAGLVFLGWVPSELPASTARLFENGIPPQRDTAVSAVDSANDVTGLAQSLMVFWAARQEELI